MNLQDIFATLTSLEGINIILGIWSAIATVFSIYQFMDARKYSERNKAQVKIWMYWAQGIQDSLHRIVVDNIQN